MTARFTGPGRKAVRGNGAASHPQLSEYISKARKVAGILINQMKLGEIWSGVRYARIADDAVVKVQIFNNIDGLEPIVNMELFIEREPVEEGREQPIFVEQGFILDSQDSPNPYFIRLDYEADGPRSAEALEADSYKQGYYDWVERSKGEVDESDRYRLTWGEPQESGGSPNWGYRYSRPFGGTRLLSQGIEVAKIDTAIHGGKIVGAAKYGGDEDYDFIIITSELLSFSEEVLHVYAASEVDAKNAEWTELASLALPSSFRLYQCVFFNAAGTKAAGLAAYSSSAKVWANIDFDVETNNLSSEVKMTADLAYSNIVEGQGDQGVGHYDAGSEAQVGTGASQPSTDSDSTSESDLHNDSRVQSVTFEGLEADPNNTYAGVPVERYAPIAVDFYGDDKIYATLEWPDDLVFGEVGSASRSTSIDESYSSNVNLSIDSTATDNNGNTVIESASGSGGATFSWTGSGGASYSMPLIKAKLKIGGMEVADYTVPLQENPGNQSISGTSVGGFSVGSAAVVSASMSSSGSGTEEGSMAYSYFDSDTDSGGLNSLTLQIGTTDFPESDNTNPDITWSLDTFTSSATETSEYNVEAIYPMFLALDLRYKKAVFSETIVTGTFTGSVAFSQGTANSYEYTHDYVAGFEGSKNYRIKSIDSVGERTLLFETSKTYTRGDLTYSTAFSANDLRTFTPGTGLGDIVDGYNLYSFIAPLFVAGPSSINGDTDSGHIPLIPENDSFQPKISSFFNDGSQISEWASASDLFGQLGLVVRFGDTWELTPGSDLSGNEVNTVSVFAGVVPSIEDTWFTYFAGGEYADAAPEIELEDLFSYSSDGKVFLVPKLFGD